MATFKVLLVLLAAIMEFVSTDVVVYTSGDYKMTLFNNDPNFSRETRQKCIDTFFATMYVVLRRPYFAF